MATGYFKYDLKRLLHFDFCFVDNEELISVGLGFEEQVKELEVEQVLEI